ncbi:MAG: hypothetical protein V4857_20570 [Pseudomonadota bacterium]
MHSCNTSNFIEALVEATGVDANDLRQQYILRQALHSLVRQAKVEHMIEIRRSVERLTGINIRALKGRQGKDEYFDMPPRCGYQQEFEFGQGEGHGRN